MKWLLVVFLGLLGLAVLLVGLAVWQPVTVSRLVWPLIEDRMLAEPFRGITADGAIRTGLFQIRATGISTAPVVEAARRFVASLDDVQRSKALFPVDDLEWRRWANIHISTRQGVGLLDMTSMQTDAAFSLMAASLSVRGFETARDIMRLEGHLADLMDDHDQYGERRYWFTIMGEPSETEPWGWQVDGHHLIVNFFVLGDQVVMTPTFMGSEPPRTSTGRFAGTSILDEEEALGLELVNALSEAQRRMAIVSPDKTGNNNRGELFQDNAVVPYEGLPLSALSPGQSELAVRLIRLYVDNMRPGHAEVRFREIVQHWDNTRFAWAGNTDPDAVFYYRLHSPVIMIEFDHQLPVALDGPDRPSRNHVHTVVRTPNGNDYGKDLLRQHLEAHPHGAATSSRP
jgi:hypothetical protein